MSPRALSYSLLGCLVTCVVLMLLNVYKTTELRDVLMEDRVKFAGQLVETTVTLADGQTEKVSTERYLGEDMETWKIRHLRAIKEVKERK